MAARGVVNRIRYVPVFVEDQDRALAFYRDVLGLRVSLDVPYPYPGADGYRWICVGPEPGATQIVLFAPGMAGEEEAEALRARVGSWTGVVLETDDVDGAYKDLRALGASFASAPADQPWGGRESTLEDPDGNQLQLTQLPSFRENGESRKRGEAAGDGPQISIPNDQ